MHPLNYMVTLESGALEFLSNRSLPMYLICGH